MKNLALLCLSVFLLSSCSTIYKGYVRSVPLNMDKTIEPDFNNYLKSKENLSVILMVPPMESNATPKEIAETNSIYLGIEKKLMEKGFKVRDRNLLSILLGHYINDYNEIAKKTDADVIIEITSLSFPAMYGNDIEITEGNPAPTYTNRAFKSITVAVAQIEFKLVQIENGTTGAISTFYLGNGSDFYYNKHRLGWDDDYVDYPSLRLAQDTELVVNEFSKYLASMLKGLE